MDDLRLRFPLSASDDLVLDQGVHGIAQASDSAPFPATDPSAAVVRFCVDRRGVWLQVGEGGRGVHVNGRPVRRMAMLRSGDAIYLDGAELLLLGPEPLAAPADDRDAVSGHRHMVLRGVGGQLHGRCFTLHQELTIGSAAGSTVRIDEPGFAERHARLVPHEGGVVLRAIGEGGRTAVNGHRVRDALLRPGDQVTVGANHRFVIEAPTRARAAQTATSDAPEDTQVRADDLGQLPATVRRVPWLLLAALLLASGLSLLLLYGTR